MGLLDGRVAVITGSGRGIGREFALSMAREGASIVINDVGVSLDGQGTEDDPAAQTCKEIEAMGKKRVGFGTELKLKRSDFNFDKGQIGNIGDEAIIIIDCAGQRD